MKRGAGRRARLFQIADQVGTFVKLVDGAVKSGGLQLDGQRLVCLILPVPDLRGSFAATRRITSCGIISVPPAASFSCRRLYTRLSIHKNLR